MAVKPFKLVLKKSEKDKTRIELPREIDSVLWAECQPNIGGDYGFKGNDFLVKILWATGFVDSSHKWLIGSLENWSDLFDIHHKKIAGKDEKGYQKYEDNPEQQQTIDTWTKQGSLVALCVDGIEQLEQLVEFAQGKVIFNHTGYTVYPTLKPDKKVFDFVSSAILEAQDSSFEYNHLKHGKIQEFKTFKRENSWFYMMVEEELFEDEEMVDFANLAPVLDNEILTLEFSDGFLQKATVQGWTPPEVKTSSGWSRGGGSKGQTEAEILKERQAYVLSELCVTSLLEVSEKYGTELCPIHVDIVMSLATGSNWTNRYYEPSGLNSKLYSPSTNGHKPKTKEELPKQEEAVTHIDESAQSNGNGTTSLAKVIGLLESPDRSFPKEISIEFLRNQDNEWLETFYSFCVGTLVTPQGDKVPFAKGNTRAIHTWIKLRVPESNGVHTLTEEQIHSLTKDKDFKTLVETVI